MNATEVLLIVAWALPTVLALCWSSRALQPWGTRLVPWAAVPSLALAFAPANEGSEVTVAFLFTGLRLELDAVGRAFLVFTALLWTAAGLFARTYHANDDRRGSFFLFFSLTMAGNIGLVLAADALSFYAFFTLMTFSAYGLVVHRGDEAAFRAGRVYIVMAVLGEIALLMGIMNVAFAAGGAPHFGTELEDAWLSMIDDSGRGSRPELVALLLIVGYGVKAGLAPLHLWLPLAHPVAPTAASALLSGAMIEAGLLGWIRFLPAEVALPGASSLLLGMGAVTVFYGVVVGLVQTDPKTVLAYSSISQMGYMAMGAGLLVGGSVPVELVTAAITIFAVHHGLAKGALFLSVGVVGRTMRQRSGGPRPLRSQMLVAAAIPGLVLAGLPLTTGALAKGTLKAAIGAAGGTWYAILDPLLPVAAFGTTLLVARFLFALADSDGLPRTGGRASMPSLGLVLPWLGLLLASASASLWARHVLWLPASLELPGPTDDMLSSALPVAVGAAVAWLARLRTRQPAGRSDLMARDNDPLVPPGDLLVPIERLLGRSSLPVGAFTRRVRAVAAGAESLRDALGRLFLRLTDDDLLMIRGPAFGALLICLAVVLGLALA